MFLREMGSVCSWDSLCMLFVFRREGITVQVVKRGEYNEDVVRWADSIISAGGRNILSSQVSFVQQSCLLGTVIHCKCRTSITAYMVITSIYSVNVITTE